MQSKIKKMSLPDQSQIRRSTRGLHKNFNMLYFYAIEKALFWTKLSDNQNMQKSLLKSRLKQKVGIFLILLILSSEIGRISISVSRKEGMRTMSHP